MFINKNEYYEVNTLSDFGLTAVYSTVKAGSPAPYNNPNGLEELNSLISLLKKSDKTLIYAKQTHSDNIEVIDDIIKESYEDVDGFITKRKDVLFATFYADCLPIYIYDKKQEVIGLCHSGWVGTFKGIGPKMLDIFASKFNSNKNDLVIALGIGIGHCCYEVSQDFYDKFKSISSDDLVNKSFYRKKDKLFFDNEDYNYYRFKELGITNITKSKKCTYCSNEFHSYRRDKENAGRNTAILSF